MSICVRVAHGQTSCREATADRTYWCLACRGAVTQSGWAPVMQSRRCQTQMGSRRAPVCACTDSVPGETVGCLSSNLVTAGAIPRSRPAPAVAIHWWWSP